MRSARYIAIEALVVFAGFALLFYWVLVGQEGTLTHDGFYHFRVASLMVSEGRPWIDIAWLPLTVLGEAGPDHHWLWHLLLAPVALLDPGVDGLKLAMALTGALVPAVLTLALRALRVPWAPLFAALAVAGGLALPGRLLMLRAQNLALCFLAGALVALARKRPIPLGVIGFLYMQAYHGAVMLAPMVFAAVVIGRLKEGTWNLRPLLYTVFGCLVALVVNPWFPRTFEYLFFHTVFKLGNPVTAEVGTEWYPTALASVATEAWPTHLLLAGCLLTLALRWRRDGRPTAVAVETWLSLSMALVFLVLFKGSWRFIEYYVPFGCLAAGLVTRDCLFDGGRTVVPRRPVVLVLLPLLVALIGLNLARNLDFVGRQSTTPPGACEEIAEHLEQHADPGEIVYNSDWDDFVHLFWHSQRFSYVNGLDPNYLLYGDPGRYLAWEEINGLGPESRADPALLIAEHFGSSWAVINRGDRMLAVSLYRSPHAELRVRSKWGSLFRILPGAGGGREAMDRKKKEEGGS